ncbi:MAG: hypothetical protein ACYCSH_16080 [Acidithiobacillus sp.]
MSMEIFSSLQRQDAKSLALFQAIQAKLVASGSSHAYLMSARDWARRFFDERPDDVLLGEWIAVLDAAMASPEGLERLYELMLSTDQHAIDLRSSSPFPGVLSQQERTAVLRAFEESWGRGAIT